MSYQNFKPELWAELINRELQKILVFGVLANRKYEGLITGVGSSIKIPSISAVTVGDYTGQNITFTEDEGLFQTIQINKAKYFALAMDSVDKVQAIDGITDERVKDAIYRMADAVDQDLAGLYTKAKHKVTATIGTDKISQKIIDLSVQMTKDNVPTGGRWLVLAPDVYGELIKEISLVSNGENTFKVNQDCYVGKWGGFTIFQSNNVKFASRKYHCMAGVSQGMTLAMQLTELDAGKFESKFGEYVKGLNVYGCDVAETETGKTTLIAEFEVTQAAA